MSKTITSRDDFFLAKVAGRDVDISSLTPGVPSSVREELLLEVAERIGEGGGGGAFFVPLTFVREEKEEEEVKYIFTSTVSPGTIVEKYENNIPVYLSVEFDENPETLPVVTAHAYDIGGYDIIGSYVIAENGGFAVSQIIYDHHSDEYVLSINQFEIPDIPEIPDPDEASEQGMALMSNLSNKYVLGWPIRKITLTGVLELVDGAEALRLTDVDAATMDNYVSTNAQLRINATGLGTSATFVVSSISETLGDDEGETTFTFDCVFDGHIYSASQLGQDDTVVFVKRQ